MTGSDATIDLLASDPSRTAILCDFDGSLAEIVDDPADAVPVPGTIEVLAHLANVYRRVAVVSGRTVDFLAAHLPVPRLGLVGLYGVESRVDGATRVDPRVGPHLDGVERAAVDAGRRLPGVLVERKGGMSVTLHWRTCPKREHEIRAVAVDLAARYGLDAPTRGRMAVELRPPVPVDKGSATEVLVEGCAVAAFVGDDAGDVPAFDALDRRLAEGGLEAAARIAVRSQETPAELLRRADLVVDGPGGLSALLRSLAARTGAPPGL